jgi:hypothetical protein
MQLLPIELTYVKNMKTRDHAGSKSLNLSAPLWQERFHRSQLKKVSNGKGITDGVDVVGGLLVEGHQVITLVVFMLVVVPQGVIVFTFKLRQSVQGVLFETLVSYAVCRLSERVRLVSM